MNHKTLPKGYRYAGSMDFMRNRKQMTAVLVLSLALMVLPVAVGLFVVPIHLGWDFMRSRWFLWPALGAALIAYIPLHELTHGAAMYALSGVVPRYGLKLPYAYAGSTVWFDRRSHIFTALAPVVLWGIALQALIALLPREWFWFLWILQISNLSGSAGDIYCAWVLARMQGDLLIQDTGVRMRIFKRQSQSTEETHS
ncbi:MAG: DUF3267 domain-containing protein [Clostridia bacterium]|nr:DUF3267 domain-containing protein [Clostridia bacterium]